MIIGGVYLPPKSPKHKYLTHLDSLESLSQAHADHNVVIFGDLNLPGLRWINDPLHTEYVGYVPPEQRDNVSSVCATYSCIGLSQLYPLHPMKNYTLDILFASPSTISIIESNECLVRQGGHHVPILCKIKLRSDSFADVRVPHFDFINADYNIINSINIINIIIN